MINTTMTHVTKQRLLKLATFLRSVDRRLFNLHHFVKGNNVCGLKKQDKNCGTAACAVGYLPVVFPRYVKYTLKEGRIELQLKKDSAYFDYYAFSIAQEFFNLTYTEIHYLFDPAKYPAGRRGPISVANRIEKFVKDGKYSEMSYPYKYEAH